MGSVQVQNGTPATAAAETASAAAATAETASAAVATASAACEVLNAPKKKKICCACPETKKIRDECIVEHGEDACKKWIEAHKICLRAEGFNV